MSLELTEDEVELAAMVRDFADTVVAPQSYEADRTHTLSMDVVRQMGDLGLFGLPFPEEYGGQGGDYMALGIAIEALARVDQSIAITLEAGVSYQFNLLGAAGGNGARVESASLLRPTPANARLAYMMLAQMGA